MTFDDRPARPTDHHAVDSRGTLQEPYDDSTNDSSASSTTVEKKQSSMVREIVETLILALIIFIAVRSVVLNFRVDGLSMTPSLDNNEMLLVNRNAYFNFDSNAVIDWLPLVERDGENITYPFGPPERGDIIVFDAPVNGASKPYIKRVIGLPGETVEARGGSVYINGQQLDESYLNGNNTFCGNDEDCPLVVVPEQSVFALGDNRNNSQDSRTFGPVAVDRIIGKAWITYWPRDVIGIVPHYDYPELNEQ
jgi:signal peptidase I